MDGSASAPMPELNTLFQQATQTLRLAASADAGRVHLQIEDDGAGVDVDAVASRAMTPANVDAMIAQVLQWSPKYGGPADKVIEALSHGGDYAREALRAAAGNASAGSTAALSFRPGCSRQLMAGSPKYRAVFFAPQSVVAMR